MLNPETLEPFYKAYKIKKKNESDLINYQAWLSGAYANRAIVSFFNRKRYPDNPLKEQGEQEAPMTDAERFGAYAAAFNVAKAKSEGR